MVLTFLRDAKSYLPSMKVYLNTGRNVSSQVLQDKPMCGSRRQKNLTFFLGPWFQRGPTVSRRGPTFSRAGGSILLIPMETYNKAVFMNKAMSNLTEASS